MLMGSSDTTTPSVVFTFDCEVAARLIATIAHSARLEVMRLVVLREWDVGSLAARVNLSQSALSQHLKKLRDAGLVTTRREAQSILYSSQSSEIRRLLVSVENALAPE